ncbi:MAG TPA: hypothetical protein PKW82_11480, partial [Spirochaetales bacterium]|nr:hypothetical protein [Spirochaetales bacterium]
RRQLLFVHAVAPILFIMRTSFTPNAVTSKRGFRILSTYGAVRRAMLGPSALRRCRCRTSTLEPAIRKRR